MKYAWRNVFIDSILRKTKWGKFSCFWTTIFYIKLTKIMEKRVKIILKTIFVHHSFTAWECNKTQFWWEFYFAVLDGWVDKIQKTIQTIWSWKALLIELTFDAVWIGLGCMDSVRSNGNYSCFLGNNGFDRLIPPFWLVSESLLFFLPLKEKVPNSFFVPNGRRNYDEADLCW